ncbi:hypothetical protein NP493_246g00027 [Ridgeia piscesae]|uniref:Uncharacterized protein n=1 Tax=Ridgeia piscesae TaxID=27915 RepID=A0AAD9NZ10_RIDPI|nr:hypothetical protein NP493_246g00027 [Ridgeia piscesae]
MWMASNYMFMNNNKTEYLPVIPKTATATALVDGSVIRVGDATITASRFVRNLGVVIDHHLDFKKQVSSIVIVCSFHLRHINKMSRYLPMVTKERVVNAIITSWLDYCNCLLYGTSVNNIARLQRIHNSAARLILRRPRRDSAMPLLCILHWLPVPQRIEFKIIAFTYKAVHGNAPKYLSDLVCPYKPARALCSANNNLLTVVRTYVKAGDNSFVVAAATLWNVLHVHSNIKTFACLATFEARLKTHFFLLLLRLSLMFVYFYRYFS